LGLPDSKPELRLRHTLRMSAGPNSGTEGGRQGCSLSLSDDLCLPPLLSLQSSDSVIEGPYPALTSEFAGSWRSAGGLVPFAQSRAI